MNDSASSLPIVVGIDGSKHALRAAMWAVDEAVSRDAQLLLTCVIDPNSRDLDREYAYAGHVLHKAWASVEGTGKPVKLESTVLEGDPISQLVQISRAAQMICVGSRGTNNSPDHQRGSTAAELAQAAFSPVAIVRRRHTHQPIPVGRWIVAALDESPASHAVLQTAMDEAGLREAPVLALTSRRPTDGTASESKDEEGLRAKLDRYLDELHDDAADVQVCVLAMPDHISDVLAQSADIDQLVIVDASKPEIVAELVGLEARKLLRHTNCSLLILRERSSLSA
jgi:nucleotide-binding universal stress UspA family protein